MDTQTHERAHTCTQLDRSIREAQFLTRSGGPAEGATQDVCSTSVSRDRDRQMDTLRAMTEHSEPRLDSLLNEISPNEICQDIKITTDTDLSFIVVQ